LGENSSLLGASDGGSSNCNASSKNIALPEFSHSIRTSHSFHCYINQDNDCPYDIILGLNFLTPVGIDVLCSQQKIGWLSQGKEILFHPCNSFDSPDQMLQALVSALDNDSYATQDNNNFGYGTPCDQIQPSKYEEVNPAEVTRQQQHLNSQQQQKLAQLLSKFPTLFNACTRKFTLSSRKAWYQCTNAHIWFLILKNQYSKKSLIALWMLEC
jgi:hypothetical protein